MIQVTGLTKIFSGGKRAVDGLNLSVAPGEIHGLLGPNGAGKTTTIRVLSTLAGFDAGQVLVNGFDVDRAPEQVRCSIGVVAQNTGIDYFLTGRENLMLQGRLYKMKKPDIVARVGELGKWFELEEALDRLVMTYSGGMRRKLDIATSLIHRPQLVFLDEPTLGLDIKSRQGLWSYIRRMNQEFGLTILLTTHYLEEIDHLAHRVSIINEGKICVSDTPEALKDSIHGDAIVLAMEGTHPGVPNLVWALKHLPGIKQQLWHDSNLHLYVDNGAQLISKIAQLAGEHGVPLTSLSLSRPSLDDVFLKYTGATLEDKKGDSPEEWWKQWGGKGGGKWAQQWKEWDTSENNAASAGPGTAPGTVSESAMPAPALTTPEANPWWPGPSTPTAQDTTSPPTGEQSGGAAEWQKWQSAASTESDQSRPQK